ncbi:MAG: Flp pilus assembly complex ATPase component TadA [Deltaproteobacteria bacterium]|nr:MAG: Flp pilus assembly complex ATPase component TadA [Deltaproteobacteria bacterium]
MRRKKLGQILVDAGLLTNDQLERVLEEQKETERRHLGKIIVERELAKEEDICQALSKQLNIPFVHLSELEIPPEVIETISRQQARRKLIIPYRKTGRRLRLAMANPLDYGTIDDVKFRTGLDVSVAVTSEGEIRKAVEQYYKEELDFDLFANVVPSAEVEVLPEEREENEYDVDELIRQSEIAPIVRLTNAILADAIKLSASDIHIEPQEKEVAVRYRIDGMMKNIFKVGLPALAPLVSRIKIIADMDIAVKRRPQDGRTKLKVGNKQYDMRISTLPTIFGEKVVIRVLDQTKAFINLEEIGLCDRDLKALISLLSRPQGIILVTGPTGSGKSTTLYAAINRLKSEVINIVTVEDPVEYQLPGISQVQVNERAGITFASGLRSILRQDPNVVMVGEIRDPETAKIAFQAANTGHLVLSTLHTNDAASAVTRLVDLGVDPYVIASSVLCVVAQRLVRRTCPHCLVSDEVDDGVLNRLRFPGGETPGDKLKKGQGCEACQFAGYMGRLGIYELLMLDEELRKLIVRGASDTEIAEKTRDRGIYDLHADCLEKLLQGSTTIEELMRVAPPPERDGRQIVKVESDDVAPEEPVSEVESRQTRVLAVDDDPFIRKMLEKVLTEAAFDVVLATNGEEALEKVYRDLPDLIISDVVMPELDGFSLVRKLKGHLQTSMIPVILLTSKDEVESEVEGLEAGADDYISKPIVGSLLLARINRIMSIYGRVQ